MTSTEKTQEQPTSRSLGEIMPGVLETIKKRMEFNEQLKAQGRK